MRGGEGGVSIPPPPPGRPRCRTHLDGDDVPRLTEAHLPNLPAGAAADLPQVLQVVDFSLVTLGGGAKIDLGGGQGDAKTPPLKVCYCMES